jgi:hypothetical protein
MKMIATAALPALLLCAVPSVAWAQDRAAASNASPDTRTIAALDQVPVDDAALGAVAGREDTRQTSLANQTAGVSRNTVGDNVTTGGAQISGNAFQNMSGLSILNVNTGNNVAVNAAMNVNIAINPAP